MVLDAGESQARRAAIHQAVQELLVPRQVLDEQALPGLSIDEPVATRGLESQAEPQARELALALRFREESQGRFDRVMAGLRRLALEPCELGPRLGRSVERQCEHRRVRDLRHLAAGVLDQGSDVVSLAKGSESEDRRLPQLRTAFTRHGENPRPFDPASPGSQCRDRNRMGGLACGPVVDDAGGARAGLEPERRTTIPGEQVRPGLDEQELDARGDLSLTPGRSRLGPRQGQRGADEEAQERHGANLDRTGRRRGASPKASGGAMLQVWTAGSSVPMLSRPARKSFPLRGGPPAAAQGQQGLWKSGPTAPLGGGTSGSPEARDLRSSRVQ